MPVGDGGREVAASVIAARLGLATIDGGVCGALELRMIRMLLDAALVLEASRHVGVA